MEDNKNIHEVSICNYLNYIDFYHQNSNGKPDRVNNCSKYREELQLYLNDLYTRIENEFKNKI